MGERIKMAVNNFLNAPLISPLNVYQCIRKFSVNLQTKNKHPHKYFPYPIIIIATLSLIHYIHFKNNHLYENCSLIVLLKQCLDARCLSNTCFSFETVNLKFFKYLLVSLLTIMPQHIQKY